MRQFEFQAFPGDDNGVIAERAEITFKGFTETVQAKAYAGLLAKRINGPVDVARAYNPPEQPTRDWADRYITTAMPSEFHVSGYRFERLDG